MHELLVIDDEPLIADCFRYLFPAEAVRVRTARTAAEGLESFTTCRPDAVALDIGLPDGSGLELLKRFHELDARVPVVLITGHGTSATAIEAMRLGAFEYVVKPLDAEPLCNLLNRAFEVRRLMRVPAAVAGDGADEAAGDLLIGDCPAMQEAYKAIGRVAPQDVTVLVLGESGTGKELVARAVYHYSRRADKPFLAINCAAVPEHLLESELFGHERGAFTGADRRRIGKFEQCHSGTIFLDEVGDMPASMQSKMLRVLQDQTFERVGGNETIRTSVRVIAATNQDLEARVAAGEFRADLFYRLNVFTIRLPPLRERGEDVLLLARHFLKTLNREFGKDAQDFSPEAAERLRRYGWPGNVRELQSVVKQALLASAGPVIVPGFLPATLSPAPPGIAADGDALPPPAAPDLAAFIRRRLEQPTGALHAEAVALLERTLLPLVLEHTGGNLSQAARILGMTRPTLRSKLAAAGLAVGRSVTEVRVP